MKIRSSFSMLYTLFSIMVSLLFFEDEKLKNFVSLSNKLTEFLDGFVFCSFEKDMF